MRGGIFKFEAFHSKVSESIELLRRDRSSLTGVPGAHGTRQARLTHYYSLRGPAGTVRTGSIEIGDVVLAPLRRWEAINVLRGGSSRSQSA